MAEDVAAWAGPPASTTRTSRSWVTATAGSSRPTSRRPGSARARSSSSTRRSCRTSSWLARSTDTTERTYDDLDEAIAAVTLAEPAWSAGDVRAKAEALTEIDEAAARSILLDNGDWDGGLSALAEPATADVDLWLIKGEQATGSYVPDGAVPTFAARIGSRPRPDRQGRRSLPAAHAGGGNARRPPPCPGLSRSRGDLPAVSRRGRPGSRRPWCSRPARHRHPSLRRRPARYRARAAGRHRPRRAPSP